MSDFFNNPTKESRHFILNQNNIQTNINLGTVVEYSAVNTPKIPTFSNNLTTGYILNSKNTMGFFNVNIKTILGDLYDKYDNFYLCLNTVYFLNSTTTLLNLNARLYYIKINGLPFHNITNRNIILTTVQPSNLLSTTSIIYPEPQYFKFSKVSVAKIEINLSLVYNELMSDPVLNSYQTSLFQNNSFHFSIFPAY